MVLRMVYFERPIFGNCACLAGTLLGFIVFANAFSCSVVNKLAERSSPGLDRIGGLLLNSGFETDENWKISAPPGYSEYGTLDFDRKIKRFGRRSAHVLIKRHPRNDGMQVMHSWMQEAGVVKAGAKVIFGGWVRVEGRSEAKLSLKCEFETPINGKNFVTVFASQPTKTGTFQYIEKTVELPGDTATRLTIHAGLSALGEAWFDDLFVRIAGK